MFLRIAVVMRDWTDVLHILEYRQVSASCEVIVA